MCVCGLIFYMVTHNYQDLISVENLFQAWSEFRKGKRKRKDVQIFERNLEDNLFELYQSLKDKSYRHGNYQSFYVQDPKQRHIHKVVKRLVKFTRIVSKNYTKDCWVLKLDIKKFFASVDHNILMNLLKKKINDPDILWLLKEVIKSFPTGIPLGNLTSQIFANIYMNNLDQFVKHKLKIRYYLRYADDFLILGTKDETLRGYVEQIGQFFRK